MNSLINFQQTLQVLEQDVQIIIGRIHELQNNYAQIKEDFSNFHLENQTLSNQVNQLHIQLSESQTESHTLSNQCNQFQHQVSKSRKENQILKNSIQRLKNIQNLSSNLKRENQNQTLSIKIHELQNKLSILQKENQELQLQINHQKNPHSEFIKLTSKLNYFQDAYNHFKFEDILLSLIQENNFYGFIYHLKKILLQILSTGLEFSPYQFFKKYSNQFSQFFSFLLTFLNINNDENDSYLYYFIYLCLSTFSNYFITFKMYSAFIKIC
jgi:predicted nuclease with TOPRIM domain